MSRYFYKAVWPHGESKKKWRSWHCSHDLTLLYLLNEPTIPLVGKLFVFRTLWQAKEFAKRNSLNPEECVFLRGVAEEPRKAPPYITACTHNFRVFWDHQGECPQSWLRETPDGTYLCSSFTPTGVCK